MTIRTHKIVLDLDWKDFLMIRAASRLGYFSDEYEHVHGGATTIFTLNRKRTCDALAKIIDFGETTPHEVAGIA